MFRFAFTVESYKKPYVQKNDPTYIKYVTRVYGKRNGKYFQKIIPYHKCTAEDYAEFSPIKRN